MVNKRTVSIHGKEYMPVAERIKDLHADESNKSLSIITEILNHDPVLVKATVTTSKGVFVGHSAANSAKTIEKQNPYEVAETSAVGRALGFAGYGVVESIATSDEMNKGGYVKREEPKATQFQLQKMAILLNQKGHTKEELYKKYNVTSRKDLTIKQASTVIENLTKLPDAQAEKETK